MTVPLKEALVPKLLQGVAMWIPNQNIEKAFLFQESYSNITCGTLKKESEKKKLKSLFLFSRKEFCSFTQFLTKLLIN